MTTKIILVLSTTVLWFVTSGNSFFQGINFKRGFEINFKPLEIQPFEFLKETWSPFGVFGKKYAVHKRSIDDMVPTTSQSVPRPVAPVFEHIDEIQSIGTEPLLIIPKAPVASPVAIPPPVLEPLPLPMPIIVKDFPPVPQNSQHLPPIATNMVIIQPTKVVNSHVLSARELYTDISRVKSVKEHIHAETLPIAETGPGPLVAPDVSGPLQHIKPEPPVEIVPAESVPVPPVEQVPSLPEVTPIAPATPPPAELVPAAPVAIPVAPVASPPVETIPATPAETPVVPPPPVPVQVVPVSPPAESIPLPVPPKAPEPPNPIIKEEKEISQTESHKAKNEGVLKENAFVKGSKMALQFGTVFLTLMAQFLDSARASIDIMTNPPPTS